MQLTIMQFATTAETINKLGIGNEGNWDIIKNSSVERILDQSETKAAFK